MPLVTFCPTLFQFTPLREGRRITASGCLPKRYFNSRPCVRGDTAKVEKVDKGAKFQFTPLREGRHVAVLDFRLHTVFQFTPLREGRPSPPSLVFTPAPFQFTPLREGRPRRAPPRFWKKYFNSRPCVRGDYVFSSDDVLHFKFQFTPLREGRPNF